MSRRRTYSKKYEYHKEDDFQKKPQKVEVSLCAVQKKEVIGIIEHMLQLDTYIQVSINLLSTSTFAKYFETVWFGIILNGVARTLKKVAHIKGRILD